jgi:hypothetical protein
MVRFYYTEFRQSVKDTYGSSGRLILDEELSRIEDPIVALRGIGEELGPDPLLIAHSRRPLN